MLYYISAQQNDVHEYIYSTDHTLLIYIRPDVWSDEAVRVVWKEVYMS